MLRRRVPVDRRVIGCRVDDHAAKSICTRMRILTFTNLFPDDVRPRHGIFVEQRLQQLLATGSLQAKVIAPVPWFPFRGKLFGAWGRYASVATTETRRGVEVIHPRYPVIPKIGMSFAPRLLVMAMKAPLRRMIESGYDFDLIDAHYFYPDGVAAVTLGRWLGKPVVITARGSDVNVLTRYTLPRRGILRAAAECNAVVTVSAALKHRLSMLGVSDDKLHVLRNGVDLELFHPLERESIRRELGVDRTLFLSIGNLIPLKGHDIAVKAVARLPETELIIVGSGPARNSLRQLSASLGVDDRVRIIENLPQNELVRYYNAADALILASSSEGMPNVVLESMACGTPVVATDVGGTSELISGTVAGELMPTRGVPDLIEAWRKLQARAPDRQSIRRHAENFGWRDIVTRQIALYRGVIGSQDGLATGRWKAG